MNTGTFLAVVSLIGMGLAPISQGREFTDSQGRKIEAELVGFSGNSVIINRGGKEFPVPVTMFSLEDQEYIKAWITENPGQARFRFGFYADLDREDGVTQGKAPGSMIDDKLKVIPYKYEMIVYNKGIAPVEGVEVRYEIYIDNYVDVVGNRMTRMAVGGAKVGKLQTIAGKIDNLSIPANGRHDFERIFNTEFYIDRDGGKTDEAAIDKVIGVRIRVYHGDKVLGEHAEAKDDHRMADVSWQDEAPSKGAGPEAGR